MMLALIIPWLTIWTLAACPVAELGPPPPDNTSSLMRGGCHDAWPSDAVVVRSIDFMAGLN